MGRHRFEDEVKAKLAQREITPSAGSWDKLSGQLNSEEKKQKPVYWWMGIAATLLGAIFITGLVYNINYLPDAPVIVDTPVEVEKEDVKEPIVKEAIASEVNIVQNSDEKNELPSVEKEKPLAQVKKMPEKKIIAEVKEENAPLDTKGLIAHSDEKISKKLEEIIAEVSQQDASGNSSSAEIDALLYKAASEISRERNIVSTGTIDAGDLLFAVEMELEESFREKVFDILKESYLKARTAVANRNY